jgi:hypothetical protein
MIQRHETPEFGQTFETVLPKSGRTVTVSVSADMLAPKKSNSPGTVEVVVSASTEICLADFRGGTAEMNEYLEKVYAACASALDNL